MENALKTLQPVCQSGGTYSVTQSGDALSVECSKHGTVKKLTTAADVLDELKKAFNNEKVLAALVSGSGLNSIDSTAVTGVVTAEMKAALATAGVDTDMVWKIQYKSGKIDSVYVATGYTAANAVSANGGVSKDKNIYVPVTKYDAAGNATTGYMRIKWHDGVKDDTFITSYRMLESGSFTEEIPEGGKLYTP